MCDGAKPNRKFLKELGCKEEMKEGVVYKTKNRYCRDRWIYFISDVPHLIKTTRNCLYSSKSSGTRYMWVSDLQCIYFKFILMYILLHAAEQREAYFVGPHFLFV